MTRAAGSRGPILIVEDDSAVAELERRALSRAGYEVRISGAAGQAVDFLGRERFSLVALDYRLPDGEAWPVLAAARSAAAPVPVILLTGMGDERVAAEAIRRGASDYIIKTGDFLDQLVRSAGQVLRLVDEEEARKARVEEALRASEEFKNRVIDASPECIEVLDLDARLLWMSENGKKTMEVRDFSTIQGVPWLDFWKGRDREAAQAAVEAAKSGRPGRFEGFCPTRSGASKWWEVMVTPILDARGRPEQLLSVSRDNTDRKRAETDAARRLQYILLIGDVGAALGGRRALREMLQACAETIALRLDAAFARIWTLNEKDRVLELQASAGMYTHLDGPHGRIPFGATEIGRIAEEGKPHVTNQVLEDPQVSDPAWARREGMGAFAGYPLIVDGQVIGVMALFSRTPLEKDTLDALASVALNLGVGIERKREEEKVRRLNTHLEILVEERTSRLRDTVQELEGFAYNVAHDLRAPLRTMTGFSECLLEDYAGKLDRRGGDFLARIAEGAVRMDALINDLLAYSKLAREEIPLEPVELSQVVAECVAELAGEIERRKADVAVEGPLPGVVGHRLALKQTVANLLSNAIKFLPPGVLPRVTVRAEPRGRRVRLWVEDNGIGIDPKFHGRIFGVFQRLHGPGKYPGTGIGLAIVRKAMERMGGSSGLESEEGSGSRFWIELPTVPGDPRPVE